jgi:hypothetical protein
MDPSIGLELAAWRLVLQPITDAPRRNIKPTPTWAARVIALSPAQEVFADERADVNTLIAALHRMTSGRVVRITLRKWEE